MPMVTVEYQAGQLSAAAKAELAEELTAVLLEIEGGGDTPFGRAGSWVRFRELAKGDWFVGGTNDGSYVPSNGPFLVDIHVPEGLLDQASISHAHKAASAAVARIAGIGESAMRSIWVQVIEWPDGTLASGGRTVSLFGIAKMAGHAPAHPVLTHPRAYFDAKDRVYDAHGFPDGTVGRGLNRY